MSTGEAEGKERWYAQSSDIFQVLQEATGSRVFVTAHALIVHIFTHYVPVTFGIRYSFCCPELCVSCSVCFEILCIL